MIVAFLGIVAAYWYLYFWHKNHHTQR